MSETVLDVGDARLFVRTAGRGHPLLVLHGGPDFSQDYLGPDLDGLADAVRLVYPDQRGRGRSEHLGPAGHVTIEREVADIDAVRRWVGAPQVALLGHSWGAVLAVEFALAHPELVSHLVLLNPGPVSAAGARELAVAMRAIRSPSERAAMRALRSGEGWDTGDRAVDDAYHRLHFAHALADPPLLDVIVHRLRAHAPAPVIVRSRAIEEVLLASTWQRDDYDRLGDLARLRMPAAVVHGDGDLVPVSIAAQIADALPTASFEVLSPCGHFAHLERPHDVRRIVLDLLTA